MNFLPRRRGQSFGGFGRSSSRKRSSFIRVKQPIVTKYIESAGGITLATGVAAHYPILLSVDDENSALVSDMAGVVAQTTNNSKVMRGSFINVNLFGSTIAGACNLWVWMNQKGMTTSPTSGYDFNQAPNTVNNQQLREKTIFYRRVSYSPNEFRAFRIPLTRRNGRNNFMPDPSSQLNLTIHNIGGGSMVHSSFGRVKLLQG